MSAAEMKKTIIEQVDTMSEKELTELKQFIDKINHNFVKEYDLLPHVESIVSEREEVMKKLAK